MLFYVILWLLYGLFLISSLDWCKINNIDGRRNISDVKSELLRFLCQEAPLRNVMIFYDFKPLGTPVIHFLQKLDNNSSYHTKLQERFLLLLFEMLVNQP